MIKPQLPSSLPFDYQEYSKLFNTIFDSILQYALNVSENGLILRAYEMTKQFINQNVEFIRSIEGVANYLKQ